MFGHSMGDEEFVKLSHFDRIRRGYFEKIPMNFGFMGFLLALNIFHVSEKIAFVSGVFALFIGYLTKEKMIDQDDAELKKYSQEIEREHKERLNLMEN